MNDTPDLTRLEKCGWNSFRPELFLQEPGRSNRDESAFFLSLLENYVQGRKVLELCSGAGALILALARAGYDCVGIDLSAAMLGFCRQALAKEAADVRERVRLIHGDMCAFSLGSQFDLVILEDECFQQLLSTDDQLACLSQVSAHLSEGGYCFFNMKTPYQELRIRKSAEHDQRNQIITCQHRWDVPDESGQVAIVPEGFQRRRLVYPCEFDLLLRHAGMYPVHKWGDTNGTPFTDPERQEYYYLVAKRST